MVGAGFAGGSAGVLADTDIQYQEDSDRARPLSRVYFTLEMRLSCKLR
jgi:hypothetical protein